MNQVKRRVGLAAALLTLSAACSDDGKPSVDTAATRGGRVYQNVCVACHNADPSQDGVVGPAIAGSSRELLEARVVRREFPPGYTPKRPGGAMPAFPYLADQIDNLAAYLEAAARP